MPSTFNRPSQHRSREAPRPNFLMSRDKGTRSLNNDDAMRISESYYIHDVVAAVVSDHEEEETSMDFSTLLQHHYEFNQIEDTSCNKPISSSNKNKNNKNHSSQRSCPVTERSSFYDSISTLGSLSGFLQETNEESAAYAIEEEEELQLLVQSYNSSVNNSRAHEVVGRQAGSTATHTRPVGSSPPETPNDKHTSYPQQQQQQRDNEERCLYDDMSHNEFDMIEVADGVMLPLCGTNESLEAIYDGRVTIARCCCCRVNLHCIDKADLVVCPDCYVVSPVVADESGSDNSEGGCNNFDLHSSQYNVVGLGFKTKDILERLEDSS